MQRNANFRKWISIGALALFASILLGCAGNSGIGENIIKEFRDKKDAIIEFQKERGKIGAFAMPSYIAIASQFLDRPFIEINDIILNSGKGHEVLLGSNIVLTEGKHILVAQDPRNQNFSAFDAIEFENQGGGRLILMLESFTEFLEPQGFSYIQLEPGATYTFKHNAYAAIVSLAIIGNPVTATMLFDEVVLDGGAYILEHVAGWTCQLLPQLVMPDECFGTCTPGTTLCVITVYAPYGPWWAGLAQAGACGCR